ncbi:hypothetical protein [Antribacter gilvus]|uniref:hypothetical protein n=1 Tax=Antribacter gilvus TaxID=2304675 RepID=UPI000F79A39E|nr:hypothetical protein [Antribacter gilvus]
MGFTGHYIFGRSDRPLREAPIFAQLANQTGRHVDIHDLWPRPGGWQTLQVFGLDFRQQEVAALATWTGAPACVAWIMDSDLAVVDGAAPGGPEAESVCWDGVISMWTAAADEEGDPSVLAQLEESLPRTVTGALAWARRAGYGDTTEPAIENVMRSEQGGDDIFFDLLDALGFPEAVEPPTTAA